MNCVGLDEVEGNEWSGTDTVTAISWWLFEKRNKSKLSIFLHVA